ncbi:MAG: ABC transporter permease [Armatimonadetes bacterium]|nr:ABC transporter permease [Armatimonadota bacterium]
MRNFSVALAALREQKSRALLSALGIAVAAVAIILLVSIALGVRQDIKGQVEDLGVSTLVVLPGKVDFGTFNPNIGGQSYLKEEQAIAVRQVAGVVRSCPMTFVGGGIRANKKDANPFIVATTSNWFMMRPMQMRSGDVFRDPDTKERVAVIGSIASDQLFGDNVDPVGKMLNVNGHEYKILGVTFDKKTEGSLFSMGSLQNVVYIPFHAQKAITPELQVDRIMIQSASDADPKVLIPALTKTFKQFLDEKQFSVLTQEDLLNLVFKVMSILQWLLLGLTSIALYVGGIGIMTVMLMSVNERSKEIGIRKTVGATRKDIFQQFMVEAVALAILGGLAGLIFSSIVAYLLTIFTPIKPLITLGVVALCFGTCLVVGLTFGLIPAVRASRKDPVDAMRNE